MIADLPAPLGWDASWAEFCARRVAGAFRCSFVRADVEPPASQVCPSHVPSRRREWWAGRRALAEAVEGLAEGPRSLSHSQGLALAVALEGPPGARVGVDLEPEDRRVADGVFERVFTPPERGLGLSGLEGWVIKEAAYKANPDSAGTWLPQYAIVRAARTPDGPAASRVEGAIRLPEEGGSSGREVPFLLLRGQGWLGCLVIA